MARTYVCRSFKANKWSIKGNYIKHLENTNSNLIIDENKWYKVKFVNSDNYIDYLISTGNPSTDELNLIEMPGSKGIIKRDHGEIVFEFTIRDNAEAYYNRG